MKMERLFCVPFVLQISLLQGATLISQMADGQPSPSIAGMAPRKPQYRSRAVSAMGAGAAKMEGIQTHLNE
jgi:hypothetical protein